MNFRYIQVLWLMIWAPVAVWAGTPAEISLFNGHDLSGWKSSRDGGPAHWKVENGYLEVVPGQGDIETAQRFGDFELKAEVWIPYLPDRHGQDRGNSGFYLQSLYEVQILDCWDNETYANGIIGALYKTIAPRVNAGLPPETWQTYDVVFRHPRLRDGRVVERGVIDVTLNGVPVIEHGEFDRPTGAASRKPMVELGPLRLQDHGCTVRFRNLILRPLD